MNSFDRSLQLFKASLKVMARHRTLLVFPLVTTLAICVIVALFMLPLGLRPSQHGYSSFRHWTSAFGQFFELSEGRRGQSGGSGWFPVIYFAAYYFCAMATAAFCNVAFYQQILNALKGEPVSVQAGLQFAATKWRAILLWTLLASAVGVILRSLEKRAAFFGQIAIGFIGAAWSVAAVFAIPVLIKETEALNPFAVLKKSAQTLKNVWGESLIGFVGVSIGSAYVAIFSLVWLVGGIWLAMSANVHWLIPAVVLSWLAIVVGAAYLTSVATQIFRCALFLYATEGNLPEPYSLEMMETAWKRSSD